MAKVRRRPRISMLKLAEYALATPRRRRAIVRGQARPSSTVVPQYRRADASAARFLRTGDLDRLAEDVRHIRSTQASSGWDGRDIANSAAALDHLAYLAPSLNLGDRTLRFQRKNTDIFISDVKVSVRPHTLIWRSGVSGSEVGAVKLCFSKTRELPKEEAQYAATLLHRFVETRLPNAVTAADLCQVVDIFGQRVTVAPDAHRRRMKDLMACCEEIRMRWPNRPDTQPPAQPWASV